MPSHNKKHSRKPRKQRLTDLPKNKKVDIITRSVKEFSPPKEYSFLQTATLSSILSITGSTSTYVAPSFYFTLSGLSNCTSFQALFDQYRINYLDVTFRPRCNSFVATSISSPPPLFITIDYDNSTPYTASSQATENSTCAIVEVYQSCRRIFKPRFAEAAYQGTFTGYSNRTGWVDCAYPDVQHYGIKTYLGQCPVAFVPQWDIDLKISVTFRNVI